MAIRGNIFTKEVKLFTHKMTEGYDGGVIFSVDLNGH